MNARTRGEPRRTGRDDLPAHEHGAATRRPLRSALATLAVAALALGGVSSAFVPAAAEELAGAEAVVETTATETTDTEAPPESDPVEDAGSAAEPGGDAPDAEPAEDTPVEEPPAGETPSDEAIPAEETPVDGAPAEEAPPAEQEPAEKDVSEEPVMALLAPPGEEVVQKVEICHATDAFTNPYVINEPAADGDVSGHAGHTGPIFYPAIPKSVDWGDIIPPFYYDDGGAEPAYFPGLNWTSEGQAIYENDCVAPPIPEPTTEFWVESCVDGSDGLWEFQLGDLVPRLDYAVDLYTSDDDFIDSWEISDTEGTYEGGAYLPPGDYVFEVWVWSEDDEKWVFIDEFWFTIEPCPLVVDAAATGCSLGDDGTAIVSLDGLIPGESYTWELNGDDYAIFDTLVPDSSSLDVPFGDLPPGNYAFYIEWDEDDSYSGHAVFFVEPCPPEIAVSVHECPAYGEDGGAVVKLSDLVEGLTYEVWIIDEHDDVHGEVIAVVGDSTHMAEVDVSPLPADMDYTAWVYAPWMPPGGSSEWGEVDWFEVVAHADFTVKPCPPVPATPDHPATPAGLAATGIAGVDGMILAAIALIALGGGAAIIGRMRGRSRTE